MASSSSNKVENEGDINSATSCGDSISLDDLRQMGNHYYAKRDLDHAMQLYSTAIERADGEKNIDALLLNLCNRSACLYDMERYEEAQLDATQALVLIQLHQTDDDNNHAAKGPPQPPIPNGNNKNDGKNGNNNNNAAVVSISQGTHLKALFRLAKAQMALKSFAAAIETIRDANNELDKMAKHSNQEIVASAVKNRKSFQQLQNEAKQGQTAQQQSLEKNKQEQETSIKFVKRPISIREFTKSRELGVGNFSEIVVCHHKVTGEQFALKMIEKKQAADLAKRQHPNVYNEIQMERRVLLERLPPTSVNNNIVKMYHAFQDYNTLYYLMDLHVNAGDMWSSLRLKDGKMVGNHRSLVKVYLAELIDALEHLHTHGIVHRDLKPENILFTASGHLLLIDFGTAKDLILTDLNGPEFVGTPDFMSPEAVKGTASLLEVDKEKQRGVMGADHSLDLYALGAVAYQLHTGSVPYWSPSPYLTFLKIKRGNLMRPWGIADDDAWDFISKLMKVEPSERLGASCFQVKGKFQRSMVVTNTDGRPYDILRQHSYFTRKSTFGDLPLDPNYQKQTPIPTLRDLCIRAICTMAQRDAADLDLCDAHPPGDGSKHDLLRLDERDRRCVLHLMERRRIFSPELYRRFFTDSITCRLTSKIRPESRDFVGLTRMTDDMGKFPDPREHDPYADPKPIDPVDIVVLSNPLLNRKINMECQHDEERRKAYLKQLKKSCSAINRTRPKVVVVCGYIDAKCRKALAKISDTISVVLVDGSTFFSFWHSGIQCLALSAASLMSDDEQQYDKQMSWLREELEQCRMARNLMFVFLDDDPRNLSEMVLKVIVRGKARLIVGPSSSSSDAFEVAELYTANEMVDDVSVKSTDSDEGDIDNHISRLVGSSEAALRTITMTDKDVWSQEYQKQDA